MLFVFYGPIIPSVTHKGLYSIGLLNTFSGSSLPSFAPIASGSGVFKIWQKGGHGERAERDPITGVWGRSPQRGPGTCLLYTSPSPRDRQKSRMPSSA